MQMWAVDTAGTKGVPGLRSGSSNKSDIETHGIQHTSQEQKDCCLLCVVAMAQNAGTCVATVRRAGLVCVLCTAQDRDGRHGASYHRDRGRLEPTLEGGEPVPTKQYKPRRYQRTIQARRSDKAAHAGTAPGDLAAALGRDRGYRESFERLRLVALPLFCGENSPRKFQIQARRKNGVRF